MVITLRSPMQLPGMVLPAGVYVFKLADSDPDRNIVEVFNKDENHLYSTFLAIPGGRLRKPIGRAFSWRRRLQLNSTKNLLLIVWNQ
jgi:hypothetical protein